MIDFYTSLLRFKDVEGARVEVSGKWTPERRRSLENNRYENDPEYRERRKRTNLASYYRRKVRKSDIQIEGN